MSHCFLSCRLIHWSSNRDSSHRVIAVSSPPATSTAIANTTTINPNHTPENDLLKACMKESSSSSQPTNYKRKNREDDEDNPSTTEVPSRCVYSGLSISWDIIHRIEIQINQEAKAPYPYSIPRRKEILGSQVRSAWPAGAIEAGGSCLISAGVRNCRGGGRDDQGVRCQGSIQGE